MWEMKEQVVTVGGQVRPARGDPPHPKVPARKTLSTMRWRWTSYQSCTHQSCAGHIFAWMLPHLRQVCQMYARPHPP